MLPLSSTAALPAGESSTPSAIAESLRVLANADDDSLVAISLAGIVSRGSLESLRWSSLRDVDSDLQRVYAPRGWSPLWTANGKLTPSARELLATLSRVTERGLRPADYDIAHLASLAISPPSDINSRAEFDLTLTVAALRSLRALYFGRVSPAIAQPTLHIARDSVDLPALISALTTSTRPDSILDAAEPKFAQYQWLKRELARYRERAATDTGAAPRVAQIEVTLERWRWLPRQFPVPPVIVNIPAFDLDVWSADSSDERPALRMDVVAGSADGRQTPILADSIRFVEFAPYWIVPLSIAKSELLPLAMRDPHILTVNNYEIVNRRGRVVVPTAASLRLVVAGDAFIRQLPGGTNSLGKVKFLFPNSFDVYLHDSPVRSDFRRVRRDQSHGCVRLADPRGLALLLLHDRREWTAERVDAAMNGRAPTRIALARAVPIYLFYATVVASADGGVRFHDDIYGFDASLAAQLSQAAPYAPTFNQIGAENSVAPPSR